MAYIAEVLVSEDALPELMNRMRVWLDHQRYAPTRFQVSDAGEQATGCRVYFEAEEEAAAFARQFDGHVLSPAAVEAIL